MIARRIRVSGRVQGVAFRFHTVERARELGLAGWVRNLRDGRVELVAQGDVAAVADLEHWCHQGPRSARVDGVESASCDVDDALRDFSIASTV